jgi:hypothetical protein
VFVGFHRYVARRSYRRKIAQLAREKERLSYERTFALHALQTQSFPSAPCSVAESQLPRIEHPPYVSEGVDLVPLGLPRLPGTYCAGTPRSDGEYGAEVASAPASGFEMQSWNSPRSRWRQLVSQFTSSGPVDSPRCSPLLETLTSSPSPHGLRARPARLPASEDAASPRQPSTQTLPPAATAAGPLALAGAAASSIDLVVGRPECVARPRGWYGSMGTSSCGSNSEIEGYLPAPPLRTTPSSLTPAPVPQPTVQPLTQPQARTETCGHLEPALEVSREPEMDEQFESPTLLASQTPALHRSLANHSSRCLTSSSSSSIGRAQGVEMRPIDERCDTASRVSPWSWIFPSRVEASNIQGDPLDSAALAAAAGGTVLPSTRSRPAVVKEAGPLALSTMGQLDQRIAKPGNSRTARSGSNGGSSYGTESELESNFPSRPPSRYAPAMTTTSPAQSAAQSLPQPLPPLLLPQSLPHLLSVLRLSPQSPPTTRSPTPTPKSLARMEALTRTLRECGLEPSEEPPA